MTDHKSAERERIVTAEDFRRLRDGVLAGGFDDVDWAENIEPPETARAFALEAIFVICNSGMKHTVAQRIYDRVVDELMAHGVCRRSFGHKGKVKAIDTIWRDQGRLFREYRAAVDKVEFCASLPWIGPITKYHLAKNFGAQVAKPDVHLQRLAAREGCSPQELCERLATETGYKVPTVDTVLWRACAIGLIDSLAIRDHLKEPTSVQS